MATRQLALYLPDGVVAPPVNPYGRLVANAGTYRALARYGDWERLHVQSRVPVEPDRMSADLDRPPGDPMVSTGSLLATGPAREAGTQLYGQAYLSEPAWIRRHARADGDYSIVGTMFAFASATHRERMVQSTLAPIREWDAIVCSSPTLARTMTGVMDRWEQHLQEHLGSAITLPRPRLPIIPFGSDTTRLARQGADRAAGAALRTRLGIGPDDVVVFSLGRLSFYDKAFPQAMFRAVSQAQAQTGAAVHLVMAGWFPDGESDRNRYEDAAAACAQGVSVTMLDGNDQDVVAQCWAAADIFLLLSDTILETFGQALVEAMAAGVPLVVSDWDGYRFVVTDGVEGFLIPTLGAAPGALGETLALLQYVDAIGYAGYTGAVAQHTAVSVPGTAAALTALIESPDLRMRMGEAGRRTAQDRFAWPVVIEQYLALFDELADLRSACGTPRADVRMNPLRGDPFSDFAALPSNQIHDAFMLFPAGQTIPPATVELDAMFPGIRGNATEAADVLTVVHGDPGICVGDVLARFPANRRPFVRNTVAWLAKSGAVTWRLNASGTA